METSDAYILFSCSLLTFYQTSGTVDADDEIAGDLGVQGTGMTGLFDAQNTFDPGDYFVGRGVGGFVEVGYSVANILEEGAAEGGVSAGNWGVVAGSDVEFIVIFQEEGPFGGVQSGGGSLGLDD